MYNSTDDTLFSNGGLFAARAAPSVTDLTSAVWGKSLPLPDRILSYSVRPHTSATWPSNTRSDTIRLGALFRSTETTERRKRKGPRELVPLEPRPGPSARFSEPPSTDLDLRTKKQSTYYTHPPTRFSGRCPTRLLKLPLLGIMRSNPLSQLSGFQNTHCFHLKVAL